MLRNLVAALYNYKWLHSLTIPSLRNTHIQRARAKSYFSVSGRARNRTSANFFCFCFRFFFFFFFFGGGGGGVRPLFIAPQETEK